MTLLKKLVWVMLLLPALGQAYDVIPGLYITYFNRAPDKAGLAYWEQQASSNGATQAFYDISSAFAQNSVAMVNYPSSMSNTEFVTRMYNYALGVTTPDSAGLNYWVRRLADGESRSNLMVEYINAVLLYDAVADTTSSSTQKQAALDAQTMIKNKVAAALYFANDALGPSELTNVPLDANNNPDVTSVPYLASVDVLSEVTKEAASLEASYAKSRNYRLTLAAQQKLNDTGITTCANGSQNGQACPQAGYPGQDAEFGRDVTYNDNSDGHAGFNFTKISGSGQALAANATSWSCVKDNVTGLMWEVKTDDNSLHDKDWTYSWYEPDNTKNGGSIGAQNGGSCGSTSNCDTYAYVQAFNIGGWCGYKDWRMPTVEELGSIEALDRTNAAIDTAYFPNTVSAGFWSSSPVAQYSLSAWYVNFNEGYDGWNLKGSGLQIRLVRSAR